MQPCDSNEQIVSFSPFPKIRVPQNRPIYDCHFVIKWLVNSGIDENRLFDKENNTWLQAEILHADLEKQQKLIAIDCLNLFIN